MDSDWVNSEPDKEREERRGSGAAESGLMNIYLP